MAGCRCSSGEDEQTGRDVASDVFFHVCACERKALGGGLGIEKGFGV